MNELVLIKGNRFGLNFIMDQDADFEALLKATKVKLTEGKKFFGNAKVSIGFEGRSLSDTQQQSIIHMIHELTDMEVFCVVDENMPIVSPESLKAMAALTKETVPMGHFPKEVAVFHQGTLRSGQELNMDTGIVILGDVNPGAKVTATGNIVVLGNLKGYAHAGCDGERQACVIALNMQPTQIRIGDVIARSPDKFEESRTVAQIAFIEDERIVIDHIEGNTHKDFKILN
ncbi:putative septum site-determining protein MinC [Petrocella atlantisensis]|uniref:Probable septum site-determining protein MinC n=1 Tax=Petrocella atlantisensis TaxID=2173034 RepID=A0A3P7NRY5_9FIRM|nr:septum site-determining protein MinC [Petrocella atlantisensis]VDN45964.1 putative septum site-determining protein MinC [Petrocella atlantisensis]